MIRLFYDKGRFGEQRVIAALREILIAAGVSDDADLSVYYGDINRLPDGIDIAIPLSNSLPATDIESFIEIDSVNVPIIYSGSSPPGSVRYTASDGSPIISICSSDTIVFGFDVIRVAIELLDELPSYRKLDEHNRPILKYESEYRRELLKIPSINFYAQIIRRSLLQIKPETVGDRLPDNAPYSLVLSHDVDRTKSTTRWQRFRAIISALRRGRGVPDWDFISAIRKYNCVNRIVEIERKYDANSTFFFGAIKRDVLDYSYNSAEEIADIIKVVRMAECEVGLHSSYYTSTDDEFICEIRKLETVLGDTISGNRGHYLRPGPPCSFGMSQAGGLSYDASGGFVDTPAFRFGIAGPFTPYDSKSDRQFNIIEMPMNCMDGTFFNYLGLNAGETYRRISEMMDMMSVVGGTLSVLWHYSSFAGGWHPAWEMVYEKILRKAKADGAIMVSHRERVEIYRRREITIKRIETS